MLFNKVMGVFAFLFAAAIARPASPTNPDALAASTLPATQALYERVYNEALSELLNVTSPSPVATITVAGRLKPHFQSDFIYNVTSKAVRQLMPPMAPFPWPSAPAPRPFSGPRSFNVTGFHNITVPGSFNASGFPNVTVVTGRPANLSSHRNVDARPRTRPHAGPTLPREFRRNDAERRAKGHDLRVQLLQAARLGGLSESDVEVIDRTVDDAQEIVYAAQIRAVNVIYSQRARRAPWKNMKVAKRGWCVCKLFGCESCSDKEW